MNKILQDTYDILEEHGWCQGVMQLPDGNVCLEGAFRVACGTPINYMDIGYMNDFDFHLDPNVKEAWLKLRRAVWEENGREYAPCTWNDMQGRSIEDVKLLLKKAIEL